MNFQPHDRIRISYKDRRRTIKMECMVISNNARFIVVNNGLYNNTIDKFDINTKKVEVELIARGRRIVNEAFDTPNQI